MYKKKEKEEKKQKQKQEHIPKRFPSYCASVGLVASCATI
jgi:hypothetical protein